MINSDKIINCLQNSGVVLFPTDTVYGLAAIPTNENAVKKIFEVKERPINSFLPIMVSAIKDLELLGLDINSNATILLTSYLVPGAITLVLGFKTSPSLPWLKGRDEIAIRIPKNEFLFSILHKTGPLLVTSANKHNHSPTPSVVSEILKQLNGTPDLIIDDGVCKEVPSTIINCRFTPVKIERSGSVSTEEIFKIINNE